MIKILKSLLTELMNQVLGSSSKTAQKKLLKYTNKCKARMEEHSLTEADVEDVFLRGEKRQEMLVRRFNGYEIGLYYFQDKRTLQYVVTAVWRSERK